MSVQFSSLPYLSGPSGVPCMSIHWAIHSSFHGNLRVHYHCGITLSAGNMIKSLSSLRATNTLCSALEELFFCVLVFFKMRQVSRHVSSPTSINKSKTITDWVAQTWSSGVTLLANGFELGSATIPHWPIAVRVRNVDHVYKHHQWSTFTSFPWWRRRRWSLKRWASIHNWHGLCPRRFHQYTVSFFFPCFSQTTHLWGLAFLHVGSVFPSKSNVCLMRMLLDTWWPICISMSRSDRVGNHPQLQKRLCNHMGEYPKMRSPSKISTNVTMWGIPDSNINGAICKGQIYVNTPQLLCYAYIS
jgi:hypothetical protein